MENKSTHIPYTPIFNIISSLRLHQQIVSNVTSSFAYKLPDLVVYIVDNSYKVDLLSRPKHYGNVSGISSIVDHAI